jgi:hypothetical protein
VGQVSQFEVEQERRNEAMFFGFLPERDISYGRRVRTGLETTQRANPQGNISTYRASHSSRRMNATTRKWAANEIWLRDFFHTILPPPSSDEIQSKSKSVPRRVVVVVERVVHKPFIGCPAIWLKIYKRGDGRLTQRPLNFVDREIFNTRYPNFFSVWQSEPSTIDCLAEWRGNDWLLIELFNPWA